MSTQFFFFFNLTPDECSVHTQETESATRNAPGYNNRNFKGQEVQEEQKNPARQLLRGKKETKILPSVKQPVVIGHLRYYTHTPASWDDLPFPGETNG